MSSSDLTVLTIATGKYFNYFVFLLPSLLKFVSADNLQILCLTDKKIPCKKYIFGKASIEFLEIKPYDWPEITLFRYEQILKHANKIKTKYFLWIDADMQMVSNFDPHSLMNGKQVFLAKHPGFIFNFRNFIRLDLKSQLMKLKEYHSVWLVGQVNIGAWEKNKTSLAHVPGVKRRNYVHGAVWGGRTDAVIEMCSELANRVRGDLKSNYTAIWHDESHLNWYAANHKIQFFEKNFSGWKNSRMSNLDKSVVMSVDKSALDDEIFDVKRRNRILIESNDNSRDLNDFLLSIVQE